MGSDTEASSARKRWKIWEHFEDERRFWALAMVLLGAVAVAKGVHPPRGWALTQAQLDYSEGFVKRGLLGAVYSLFGVHHLLPLQCISWLQFLGAFGLVVWFSVRSGLAKRVGSCMLFALFSGSYAVTFLTHIVGYSDIVNLTLLVLLLLVRDTRTRFLLALPTVVVALLIHESFLLLFLPLLLFSFLLDGMLATKDRERAAWIYTGLLGALATGTTMAIASRASLTNEGALALKTLVQSRMDFPITGYVFAVLQYSFVQNLQMMKDTVLHASWWWDGQLLSLCNLLPLALLLLHFIRRLWLTSPLRQGRNFGRYSALMVVTLLLPLGMHVLGWDAFRWNVLAVLEAFLLLLTLSRALPMGPMAISRGERNAIVLVIAIQMATGHGLFDRQRVNLYPFFPDVLHGGHMPVNDKLPMH